MDGALQSKKLIDSFLLTGFFHDNTILSIDMEDSKAFKMSLYSYNTHEAYGFREEDRDKSIFILSFKNCQYIKMENETSHIYFLRGDLLDSETLQDVKEHYGKDFYHYFMTTSEGYIEIIFERFGIKKQKGRITKIPEAGSSSFVSHYGFIGEDETVVAADMDDEERIMERLKTLERINIQECLALAREAVRYNCRDGYYNVIFLAAEIIGKYGKYADMETLMELYAKQNLFNVWGTSLLLRRKMLEAAESIMLRKIEKDLEEQYSLKWKQ